MAEREALIEAARRQIGLLEKMSVTARLPLGCAQIDACLKGGLAAGALHEVAAADHRAAPTALGFLLVLARIAVVARGGALIWPQDRRPGAFGAPYGPGLKHFGLDPGRIVFLRCRRSEDALWAMEEALRIGGVGAVVGARTARMDLTASRRLQLAAEASATPAFLLRAHKDAAPSAAATRWRVSPVPSARDGHGVFARPRWLVALERARGGKPGEWVMEWDHDALCLRPSAGLGGGALPQNKERSAA